MEPERKLEPKAADSRPVEDGGAYYMVGPFGRVEKWLMWCAVSVGLVAAIGCLLALSSIDGRLAERNQLERIRGK